MVGQLFDLAVAHQNAGKLIEAETLLRRVLSAEPNHAEALHRLGLIRAEIGATEEAVALIFRATAIDPRSAAYQANLGAVLAQAGRFAEAEGVLSKAISIQPNLPDALINLGRIYREQGRLEQAIDAYQRALRTRPDSAEAMWNLGLALLLAGDFARGWPAYEARRQAPGPSGVPLWDGSPLAGRCILLLAEQGFGDTIQFARYAPLLAERGARVVLTCPPALRRLMESLPVGVELAGDGETVWSVDVYCPLMSLPRLMGTTLESIPAAVPYLAAPKSAAARWRQRLEREPAGLNVGVAWAGRPGHANDRNRSLPLRSLDILRDVPDVQFFSLQRSDGPAISVPPWMADWTGELSDFAETAALMEGLDLVICVDTSVAHLAGALGRRAWVLLPFAPDWRWMLERSDSPWYPTMRLYRQRAAGDWAAVLRRVADDLQEERLEESLR